MEIKQLLKIRNKTKQNLADAVGVTTNTLRNYERGKNDPLLTTVIEIAKYLDCSLETLTGWNTENIVDKKMLSEEKRKLVDEILNLDPDKVSSVLAFIEILNKQK